MGSKLHISICGGGIAGLALAVIIGKYSTLPVEVFEAGPTITSFGAGIGFYGRTLGIMRELGVYEELAEVSVRSQGPQFRRSDRRDGHYWFSPDIKPAPMMMHRKDLIDSLFRQVSSSCTIHTSKRLDFYDVDPNTGKITLHFTDGSSTVTDVLVGADGIRSATRKTMYKRLASLAPEGASRTELLQRSEPLWTGTLVYRNLIPIAKIAKEHPDLAVPSELVMHIGKNKHIVTFPISEGQTINIVIFLHNLDAFGTPFEGRWVTDVSEKEVLDEFEDWDISAKALVKCVEKPSRWALHSLLPLPHAVSENVALIGDAAHAMEPHLGAGAGQAIEDALVLGRLLAHELTCRENVADALKFYEQVRLPFANGVAKASQTMGRYYGLRLQGHGPDGDSSLPVPDHASSPEEFDRLRKLMSESWEWQNEPARIWDDAEKGWRELCARNS